MKKEYRKANLFLTDEDWRLLGEKAAIAGMTIGELLTSFVQDLTLSDYRNGSDESDLAEDWYDRCGFEYYNDSLLSWLVKEGEDIDDFVTAYDEYQAFNANPEDYKDEVEDDGTFWATEEVEKILTDYRSKIKGNPDISREIERCCAWLQESKGR